MNKTDFSKKIYLGITGEKNIDWQLKLKEINRLRISSVAVFLERLKKQQRTNFYRLLLKSSIKRVPLVHLRNDVEKDEIKFFIDNFQTQHFSIHEDSFKLLDQWKGYWNKLYLEMNYDDRVARNVKVRKIGGFCIDLSHFKSAITRGNKEAYYAFIRKGKIRFSCNHLNGYSSAKMRDKHIITSLNDFDYLTTLPKYVFGKIIALEVENSIKQQIKFKEHLIKLLNKRFLE